MPKMKDVTGSVYGQLSVIAPGGRLYGKIAWLCRCKCGNELTLPLTALVSGNTKSCGCLKRTAGNRSDTSELDGQRFTRLTVMKWAGSTKGELVTGFWIAVVPRFRRLIRHSLPLLASARGVIARGLGWPRRTSGTSQ